MTRMTTRRARASGQGRRSELRGRAGFSLVELLVAMTILVMTMTGLLVASLATSRRTLANGWRAQETAVIAQEAGRLAAAPFTSLTAGTTCTSVQSSTAMPYRYTQCVVITSPSSKERQVTVRVTPTDTRLRTDSVVFRRAKLRTATPVSP
jgi:prepilin-type N-terminal cleavage/methylation domain-containing protein